MYQNSLQSTTNSSSTHQPTPANNKEDSFGSQLSSLQFIPEEQRLQTLEVVKERIDPFNGMVVVIASRSDTSDNRIPTLLRNILKMGEEQQREGGVPLKLVLAEWGGGFSDDDRALISQVADTAGVKSFFMATSKVQSNAGHSFNEGVRYYRSLNQGLNSYVMKLDDDSVSGDYMFQELAQSLRTPEVMLAAPVTHRVVGNLADEHTLQQHLSARRPNARQSDIESWSGLIGDNGKLDLTKLMTMYTLPTENGSPNENGLVFSPQLANLLIDTCGELFLPDRRAGEGVALYTLITHMKLGKIIVNPNAIVLDRPSGIITQRYQWGIGDSEFAETLIGHRLLREGITIAHFDSSTMTAPQLINIPSPRYGVIRYPDRLAQLISFAEADPTSAFQNFTPEMRNAAESALTDVKELLRQILPALKTPPTPLTIETPFVSAPGENELSPEQLRGSIAHLAGHYAGVSDKGRLILATA
jgi:hypothetical protein